MERLIDPDEMEDDLPEEDTWDQRLKGSSKELEFRRLTGYERPFLLQGLFSRAGDCSERSRAIKKNWAEAEDDAPGDKVIPPPFDADRNAQRLLKDQESDAETWELLNYLRYKAGEKRAEKIGAKDELRLRSAAAKHSLIDLGPWPSLPSDPSSFGSGGSARPSFGGGVEAVGVFSISRFATVRAPQRRQNLR